MSSQPLLILFFAALASAANHGPANLNAPRVTAAIEDRMKATGAVGVSVAIVRNGKVTYERGFGRKCLNRAPVDKDTRFEIGSLTKQFTAAAILQLKERGALRLQDRVSKYLPGFPHAPEITLLQLLNQTSGLPDFMQVNHFVHLSQTAPGGFRKIQGMAQGPLRFPPGSRWEYSNTNYIALGRIIEVVSGLSYDAYVRSHLFRAAGMQESATVAGEDNAHMACGYWRGLKATSPQTAAPRMRQSWSISAGDIISTAGDIARWDIALESGRIIKDRDFELMTEPARLANGKLDDYGFHWWIDRLKGHRRLEGLGDTYGFSSSNDLFLDDNLAIVVLVNSAIDSNGKPDAAERFIKPIFETMVRSSAPSSTPGYPL